LIGKYLIKKKKLVGELKKKKKKLLLILTNFTIARGILEIKKQVTVQLLKSFDFGLHVKKQSNFCL
jgi:hypothetical protein